MFDPEIRWYAVQTRSRHEKVVAEQLWLKEIECFLPLHERFSQWKDRRKRVQFPLFPGYLFVRVPLASRRLDIMKVSSVVRLVGFNGQTMPIPDEQIQAVKTLVFSELPLDPYPYIQEGDWVRIKAGPLRGLKGMLIEKKTQYRFILSVDLIQQSVSCEIDADLVEKI